MKRVLIFIALGIFLLLIARYLLENFSPFNLTMLQRLVEANNIKPGDWDALNKAIEILIKNNQIIGYLTINAYVAAGVIVSGLFCIFVGAHLVIDKFFFKNFYEKASMFDAIRRGILLCTGIIISIYLNLYGFDVQTILFINIFILAIEILFFVYIKHHLKFQFNRIVEFNKKIVKEVNSEK